MSDSTFKELYFNLAKLKNFYFLMTNNLSTMHQQNCSALCSRYSIIVGICMDPYLHIHSWSGFHPGPNAVSRGV